MHTKRVDRHLMPAAVLTLAMLACSTVESLVFGTPESVSPEGADTAVAAVRPGAADGPIPELQGYWQDGLKVYTILWQDDAYVVTAVNSVGEGDPQILEQSWDGSSLTWTYKNYAGADTYSMVVQSVSGDRLNVQWSGYRGTSGPAALRRTASATPASEVLPFRDAFSDPGTGWDVFENEFGSTAYENGYYSVRSLIKETGQLGYAYRYFTDPVIAFDVTAVSGPSSNEFGFFIGCNDQLNGNGYEFMLDANGYFTIGKYTNNGEDYESLIPDDEWRFSSAIRTGQETNQVVAMCARGRLRLEVNGKLLWEAADDSWSEGDINLGVISWEDTPAEYHFDNLEVTAPWAMRTRGAFRPAIHP